MALLGLVLRALGVALLTATVLLPIADHHAASLLPESFAKPESVHDMLTHHHAHPGAAESERGPTLANVDGVPTAVPALFAGTSFWAEGAVAPAAAFERAGGLVAPAPSGWLGGADALAPPSVDRAPPAPPPIAST